MQCVVCGSEFEPRTEKSIAKTCSAKCGEQYRVQRTVEASLKDGAWVTKACAVCGKEFTRRRGKVGVVCSIECRATKQKKDSKEARTCVNCGKVFDNYHRQSQNTCSVKCAAEYRSEGRHYPPCETCGKPTGSYYRAFCDDHLGTRRGRKPMPRKTAVCQTCGEEFSRPGTWPGKMMFCSLDCSKKDPSYRRIKRYSFGDLNAEGGYELRFLACLQRLMIDWEAWPNEDQVIYTTPDRKKHVYTPDFLVGDFVVEVKGWEENPDSTQSCAHAQWNRSEKLVVVDRAKLAKLEHIFDREQFLKELGS